MRDLYEPRLTPASLATGRMAILDCLGCIVAGSATPTATLLTEYASEQGGVGPASVIGTNLKLTAPMAALANGTAGHVLDYDDMSSTLIGHPSVVLVPAIFALAQSLNCTGAQALHAYVLGFEIDAWFGRRMIPRHYNTGWHATSSLGIFGATAAACDLLGLEATQMLNGLAIAASNVAGLRANFGTMTKSLHAGQAAEGGLRAALLSARGFTGNSALFDTRNSFFELYGAESTPAPAPVELEIDATGIGIKPYACCGAGQSVIDAGLDLFEQYHPRPADMISIECRVSAMATQIMPFQQAKNGLEAKYCLAYCLAVSLLDGQGGLAQFDDARVVQDDVNALMCRISIVEDATMVSGAGRFGVALEIKMQDGQLLRTAFDLPRGHPQRPLANERLEAKFLGCVTPVIGQEQARQAIDYVAQLEQLDKIGRLLDTLCPQT